MIFDNSKGFCCAKQLCAIMLVGLFLFATAGFACAETGAKREKIRVFVGAMFEIGENTGDRAGEFQNWYEKYWKDGSTSFMVEGAPKPVFVNKDGVAGAVLGMGKVRSATAMQAILLDPRFDFSETYFIISGVAGTPPSRGTIGEVSWSTWLVDYDLGHRWAPEEGKPGEPTFIPRKGYESVRVFKINPALVAQALDASKAVALKDSDSAKAYRQRYPQEAARKSPFVSSGTHIAGDCFFHGPGMSEQAQYIAKLYGADDYIATEMEGTAIAHVLEKHKNLDRTISLRGAVNFDQGNPNETTREHLDPAPGQTAGGFAETTENIVIAGSKLVDRIVADWDTWKKGIPAVK